MNKKIIVIVALMFLCSCANKKEILYLQDAEAYNNSLISYISPKLQPNDILRIIVGTLEPESAIPYNSQSSNNTSGSTFETMKLGGYIISSDNMINFPEIGLISTKDKTPQQLQDYIKKLLVDGGHLLNPTVNVRVLNSKFTVLGEVNRPGTYDFTEQNITLLQALGYAGDLTINGKREDILIMREGDSLRKITHLDITSAEILESPFYNIKTNDVIIVNPNGPRVKSAGFVGNVGTFISVFSILLSTILIITR